jgi:hypothetical protein
MVITDYKVTPKAISVSIERDKWRWKIFRFRKMKEKETYVARIDKDGYMEGIYNDVGDTIYMYSSLGEQIKSLVKLAASGVDIRTMKPVL